MSKLKQVGIVISYHGNSVAVETQDGQVFHCYLKRNQPLPVVGDKVDWHLAAATTRVITHIYPRTSLLARGNHLGQLKPLAANVDYMLIVMSPPPIFSEYLIDRYLIAAELLKIKPILIINKSDLLSSSLKKQLEQRMAVYQQLNYPVLLTSVLSHKGLRILKKYLYQHTAVLVGPSGVGKSSLIGALSPGANTIRIGPVSKKGSGKHTTTTIHLYPLKKEGYLIDSPGVREFNLWKVDRQQLLAGFVEFAPYTHECKFRDCQHLREPYCGIRNALEAGKISATRYDSYKILMTYISDL